MSKSYIKGDKGTKHEEDFGNTDFKDHKIKFVTNRCVGKRCLDLGCVHHNPENYKSKYWLHKAILEVAEDVIGLDIYSEGVEKLRNLGFRVIHGNAENFDFDKSFDVIVAGDLIEHLEDLSGFLESCRRNMNKDGKLLISTPNPFYWKTVASFLVFGDSRPNSEHTHWQSPSTLRQLLGRHKFQVREIKFGSRYNEDIYMPLPYRLRHTSFHVEAEMR